MKKPRKDKTEFMQAVDYICKSFNEKFNAKYPFMGRDGKIVKRLVGNYGLDMLCALWQEFLDRDWSWYDRYNMKIPVAHTVAGFASRVTFLLEEGKYKEKMGKLVIKEKDGQEQFSFQDLLKNIGKAFG